MGMWTWMCPSPAAIVLLSAVCISSSMVALLLRLPFPLPPWLPPSNPRSSFSSIIKYSSSMRNDTITYGQSQNRSIRSSTFAMVRNRQRYRQQVPVPVPMLMPMLVPMLVPTTRLVLYVSRPSFHSLAEGYGIVLLVPPYRVGR